MDVAIKFKLKIDSSLRNVSSYHFQTAKKPDKTPEVHFLSTAPSVLLCQHWTWWKHPNVRGSHGTCWENRFLRLFGEHVHTWLTNQSQKKVYELDYPPQGQFNHSNAGSAFHLRAKNSVWGNSLEVTNFIFTYVLPSRSQKEKSRKHHGFEGIDTMLCF